MTDEQTIQLAEQHFSYLTEYAATGWFADTEDLLKFARLMYNKGHIEGAYEQSKRYMKENLK
jgi:hypothetical protein